MKKSASGSKILTEVELEGRRHPLIMLLAGLPVLIALLALMVIVFEGIPLPLIGLLLATVASACCVSYVAIEIILGGKLVLGDTGLKRVGPFGEELIPWQNVKGAKVVPATGTFGDDPFQEIGERIGLGLFLREANKAKDDTSEPDVILMAAEKPDASRLMNLAEKLEKARHAALVPQRPVSGGRRPSVRQAGQRRQFRNRPETSGKQLVGKFRQP